MKCPNCGNKLPRKAKYCDKCGFDLSNRSPMQIKNSIIWICIVFALVISVQSLAIKKTPNNTIDQPQNTQTIPQLTLEQYNAMEEGMDWNSYLKAVNTGKKPGATRKGRSISDTEYKAVFGWAGEYSGNKCVVLVTFDKNGDDWRISEIRENNFLDGREIYYNKGKTSRTSLSFEELENIPDGTSYEDFVNITGSRGILISSWSRKGGSSFKQYEWIYENNNYQFTYDAVFCDGYLNRNLEN